MVAPVVSSLFPSRINCRLPLAFQGLINCFECSDAGQAQLNLFPHRLCSTPNPVNLANNLIAPIALFSRPEATLSRAICSSI